MTIFYDETEEHAEPIPPPIATKGKHVASKTPKKSATKVQKKTEPKKSTKGPAKKVKSKKFSRYVPPIAFGKTKKFFDA